MINLCTVCDKDYLLKGLALYNSLLQTTSEAFRLFWLCIDQETYDTLEKLDLLGVRPMLLSEIEASNPDLVTAKNNPPSRFGNQYQNYCWALCPYFTHYILTRFLSSHQKIIYVDSDIFFYQSPKIILDAMGSKSVALHTHRFGCDFNENIEVGWFNIGVLVFANDEMGNKVALQWKNWLLDTNNPYYSTHGICGDQKYAELFPTLIGWENICVFDRQADIMHLAPWCIENPDNKSVAFFHFSHFQYDLNNHTWRDSMHGEWNPSKDPKILPYYQDYFNSIVELSKKLL